MKTRCVVPMWIAKIGYMVMSVLFCAAGILFMALPEISETAMGIGVGVVLILFGALKLVGYFSKDLFRLAFQFDLAYGLLLLVLGVIMLFRPEDLMRFLCVALGITILLDGLLKIQISMDSRKFGIQSWWLILAFAIATGLAGAALVGDCVKGAWALNAVLGVCLLLEGVLNFYTVLATVRIVNHQRAEVREAEDR